MRNGCEERGHLPCKDAHFDALTMFSDGIQLENSGSLIPWGTTASEACYIGRPRVIKAIPRVDILWEAESVFSAMAATIHATLHGGEKLRKLMIEPAWEREPYDLRKHYIETRDHLCNALGSPTIDTDPFTSMPSYTWVDGRARLRLWLFDRFGERLMLEASV